MERWTRKISVAQSRNARGGEDSLPHAREPRRGWRRVSVSPSFSPFFPSQEEPRAVGEIQTRRAGSYDCATLCAKLELRTSHMRGQEPNDTRRRFVTRFNLFASTTTEISAGGDDPYLAELESGIVGELQNITGFNASR